MLLLIYLCVRVCIWAIKAVVRSVVALLLVLMALIFLCCGNKKGANQAIKAFGEVLEGIF